jgi:predicted RNA-binding Zn-ribbon protein involved in translation (DUF1610 family)
MMAAKDVGHAEKMCALTCCACNLDVAKVKSLVKDAKFVCKSCGHVAAKRENLCRPTKL